MVVGVGGGRGKGIELGSRDPRQSALGGQVPSSPQWGAGWGGDPVAVGLSQSLPLPRPTRSCERPLAGRERHCLKPQAGRSGAHLETCLGLGFRPGTWKMTWWGSRGRNDMAGAPGTQGSGSSV